MRFSRQKPAKSIFRHFADFCRIFSIVETLNLQNTTSIRSHSRLHCRIDLGRIVLEKVETHDNGDFENQINIE